MWKQKCLQRLLRKQEKVLASAMKCPQQKMSTNASPLEDGILFTVFWNMFMVEIKKNTTSMNKIKDA